MRTGMANSQDDMSFYGKRTDMFSLVLNSDHKLIKEVLSNEETTGWAERTPSQTTIDDTKKQYDTLQKSQEGKKDEEIATTEKDHLTDLSKKLDELKKQKESIITTYANGNKIVRQLVDLALLQNNMLKGEALNNFVKRSIDLI